MLAGEFGRVRWAFSDRFGGTSLPPYESLNLAGHVGDDPIRVDANRRLFAGTLGVPAESLVFMNQVHGAVVTTVRNHHAQLASCDGIVTSTPGQVLVVLVADCVPVLLADPVAEVVGAVHAGRPGVQQRIVRQAHRAMLELGADPSRIKALLGPAVCGLCYEVPEDMRGAVAAEVPATWAQTRTGTPALDLRAGLLAELAEVGVAAELTGPCTMESAAHFSYRRETKTGRLAGAIWVTK